MKNRFLILLAIVVIFLLGIFEGILLNIEEKETIKYHGKEYVYLEYNSDIFVYDYISDMDFEVDKMYLVKVGEWDAVYSDGDLFVAKNQVKEAVDYYNDDKNYEWYFVFDNGNEDEHYFIELSESEKKFLYSVENKKREETIVFEDIQNFGSIKKISKDKAVSGVMSLAKVNDKWYWKSESMTEDDREYVVVLPQSLNLKIKSLLK